MLLQIKEPGEYYFIQQAFEHMQFFGMGAQDGLPQLCTPTRQGPATPRADPWCTQAHQT